MGAPHFAITDPDGATTILQLTDDGHFINTVITTQSDQTIRQDTALTITLPGFDAVQTGFIGDKMGIWLNKELGDVVSTLGR